MTFIFMQPGNILVDGSVLILFDFGSVGEARHKIQSSRDALALKEWADRNW